ncbi:hypothetical protein K466DRAFT_192062 [Polyporus arcularius HHB13444]|uniref:Uncharacterized protein n=1 Tax=Polyporus arcularius HHB13444 TaxID=1314778 RepID=A0A5C3PHD7_9APHY|nr:hypothetical protein K466DRAFT_192062 [Polyporus arcularius HHB13444]
MAGTPIPYAALAIGVGAGSDTLCAYSRELAGAGRLRSLASRPIGLLSVDILSAASLFNGSTRTVRFRVRFGHVTTLPPPGAAHCGPSTLVVFRDSAITRLADDRLLASSIILVIFPTDSDGRTGLLDPNIGAQVPERPLVAPLSASRMSKCRCGSSRPGSVCVRTEARTHSPPTALTSVSCGLRTSQCVQRRSQEQRRVRVLQASLDVLRRPVRPHSSAGMVGFWWNSGGYRARCCIGEHSS